MFKSLLNVMKYEITITFRQAYSWCTPLLFFIVIVCLFPLAFGPDDNLLQAAAGGIIWVSALLAVLMSVGNVFRYDAMDGFLDLLLLSPIPLTYLVICKIITHWITHCLPLILISPLLGLFLQLNLHTEIILVISLLLGTPVLCLLGAVGAALIIGVRHHGLLLPILIMPLYIPVLIFGTSAITASTMRQDVHGYFAIMGAFILLTSLFAPLLTSAALRIGVNQ